MNAKEVVSGPLEVWTAEVGATMPNFGEEPGEEWTRVGTNGSRNYDEEGVTLAHPETITEWYSLGSTLPIQVFRSREGTIVGLMMADMTLEQYAYALNGNTVTEDGGVRSIPLVRGFNVKEYAVCVRGQSPYDPTLKRQYNLPRAYQRAEQDIKAVKDKPAMLKLEFVVLKDLSAESEEESGGTLLAEDGDT